MKNERIDERLNPIKDLEFVITDDMKETIFDADETELSVAEK